MIETLFGILNRAALVGCLLPFGFASAAVAQTAAQNAGGHHQHPRTAEEWVKILEDPGRDAWQKPTEVVRALDLKPGTTVADIGAGSGYFSARFARAVGPQGKVFAADIDSGLVDHLKQRAAAQGLANLVPVLSVPDDPKLPAGSTDVIFICDVIHHIENRADYYPKLRKALRPGGRLAIVDFYKQASPVGPPATMRIAKAAMIAELQKAGFELLEQLDFLPYQYILMFEAARR